MAEEAGSGTRTSGGVGMTPDEMRVVNARAADKIKTAFWVGIFVGVLGGCCLALLIVKL